MTNLLVDTAGCASCGAGLSQVIAETNGSDNLTALYVRAGDELLEVLRPGATSGTWMTRFVHHDGLGSVRALTDESGTTVDTRAYEAFGTKNTEAGSDPLSYGFAGEPFEETSMLAYHRARWMDARVGRFVGMDWAEGDEERPITWHRYVYGENNPTNLTDPSGHTALQGILVHNAIGVHFLAASNAKVRNPYSIVFDQRCRLSNSWISTIFGIIGAGRARPDLIDRCTKEIWEIKQWDDEGAASSDLDYYVGILASVGDTYSRGASYEPLTYVPLPGNNSAAVWAAGPGVILYRISSSNFSSPEPSTFAIPGISGLTDFAVDVGVGGL